MSQFDIEIAVRVYPGRGGFCTSDFETKLDCFANNMHSLCVALSEVYCRLHIIFDACDVAFIGKIEDLIAQFGIDYRSVVVDVKSNPETFLIQRRILQQSSAKLVLLLEDDYYVDSDAVTELLKFAEYDSFRSFYTGFNSSDYYSSALHTYKESDQQLGCRKWRSVASTTLSFACAPDKLIEFEDLLATFSRDNNDYAIWLAITKRFPSLLRVLRSSCGVYFGKRIVKMLRFSGRWLLRPPVKLWAANPGTMHHLDSRAPSKERVR